MNRISGITTESDAPLTPEEKEARNNILDRNLVAVSNAIDAFDRRSTDKPVANDELARLRIALSDEREWHEYDLVKGERFRAELMAAHALADGDNAAAFMQGEAAPIAETIQRLREENEQLRAALRTLVFNEAELDETIMFSDDDRIFIRPDDGNDSVKNGWHKTITFADVRSAASAARQKRQGTP